MNRANSVPPNPTTKKCFVCGCVPQNQLQERLFIEVKDKCVSLGCLSRAIGTTKELLVLIGGLPFELNRWIQATVHPDEREQYIEHVFEHIQISAFMNRYMDMFGERIVEQPLRDIDGDEEDKKLIYHFSTQINAEDKAKLMGLFVDMFGAEATEKLDRRIKEADETSLLQENHPDTWLNATYLVTACALVESNLIAAQKAN